MNSKLYLLRLNVLVNYASAKFLNRTYEQSPKSKTYIESHMMGSHCDRQKVITLTE
jgi:hypothetical protein